MSQKKNEILKVAESMIRKGGYHSFSFRDIAKVVGIKSASVHYYYPTKESLGAEVAQNYTTRFIASLGQAKTHKDPIEVYIAAFKASFLEDKQVCLCGLLGAESTLIPPAVKIEVTAFFTKNIKWLTEAYTLISKPNPEKKATHILAILEGAMILSKSMNNTILFDDILNQIEK